MPVNFGVWVKGDPSPKNRQDAYATMLAPPSFPLPPKSTIGFQPVSVARGNEADRQDAYATMLAPPSFTLPPK